MSKVPKPAYNSMPAITVLMPVYNAERFLTESIESILNQTFQDFEFLIIDDGSTDGSASIIRSYTDTRIRFLQNEINIGISETLNMGVAIARSELIARMDADDISSKDRLDAQFNHFLMHPECALLSANARVISEDRSVLRFDNFTPEYYYYNLNFICWIYHSSVMYRRSAVLSVGGYTEQYAEDFDLWWKIARLYKISHLDQHLLDYRETSKSTSTVTKKIEYENAQVRQVNRNLTYFAGNGFFLTYEEIQCFRHDFHPIMNQKSIRKIVNCLNKLKYLTEQISRSSNMNCDKQHINEAFQHKREYIIAKLKIHLHPIAAGWLDLRTGNLKRGLKLFLFSLSRNFR